MSADGRAKRTVITQIAKDQDVCGGLLMPKKPPTAAESAHMERVQRCGCVVCRLSYGAYVEAQVHHMTAGGRRLGHFFVLPLCPWHHEAVPSNGLTPDYMRKLYGPSFAESREEFETTFGTEEYLLEQTKKWLGLPTSDSGEK